MTIGGGCFWCVEAVFERQKGVIEAISGYSGGYKDNPTYQEVCTGDTGHAEVVQIRFDPEVISYDKLLQLFWIAHDPTTLNRQGADVGTQYRSVIFYHNDEQRVKAEASLENAQKDFADPIVTEIAPLENFFPAEDYHQEYFDNNRNASFCRVIIAPKLKKLGFD
ncbi:peptide-methionine (S)-S-oxide reductase MsrA [Spirochaeta cellobiosiphila]|uniref:peptide-methionine (S)-S-oxide reductase MsrA n=1 Tax=Spirochaeta cellobiosiphila TaxID=504483 RepID=UPI0005697189|nr:peptide-methionine (S)-S-oxide reductase MsrA [Spirochaeta cellobiosiphila]